MSSTSTDKRLSIIWLLAITFACLFGGSSLLGKTLVESRDEPMKTPLETGYCMEAIATSNPLLTPSQASEPHAMDGYPGVLSGADPLGPEALGSGPQMLSQIAAKRQECGAFLWVTQTSDAEEMFQRAVVFTHLFPESVLLPRLPEVIRPWTGHVELAALKTKAGEMK